MNRKEAIYMPDSSTISIWIPLASTIVGGLIALSGTYLMDFLKDKKKQKHLTTHKNLS